VRKTHVKN